MQSTSLFNLFSRGSTKVVTVIPQQQVSEQIVKHIVDAPSATDAQRHRRSECKESRAVEAHEPSFVLCVSVTAEGNVSLARGFEEGYRVPQVSHVHTTDVFHAVAPQPKRQS